MKKFISSLLIVCLCVSLFTPFATVESSAASNPVISISKNKMSMTKNTSEKLQIVATKTAKSKISKTTWSSSNTKVATVNKYGKVTAKKAGSATITATVVYKGSKKYYKCAVTVADKWAKIHESSATYKASNGSKSKYSIRIYAHYQPKKLAGKLTGRNYINQIRFDVKKGTKGTWKSYYTNKTGVTKYTEVDAFLKNRENSVYDEYVAYFKIRAQMGIIKVYANRHKDKNGKIDVEAATEELAQDITKRFIQDYIDFVRDQFSLLSIAKDLIMLASPAAIAFLVDIEGAMGDMSTMSDNIVKIVENIGNFAGASDYIYELNGEGSLHLYTNQAGKCCKCLYNAIIKI